jgi:hypothetical protein
MNSKRKDRPKRHRTEPELKVHEYRTDNWHTSADLPPLTALAQADPFFKRVEEYVRVSQVAEHGISEQAREVVPIVTLAESFLPPWTRETRAIHAAKVMLAEGPDAPSLWRLWGIDVLDAAGILAAKDLFTGTNIAKLNTEKVKSLSIFSREAYAFHVVQLLQDAERSSDKSEAIGLAFEAGRLAREYAFKVTREAAVDTGERVSGAVPRAAKASGEKRGRIAEENHAKWVAEARRLRKTDRGASLRSLAERIANGELSGGRTESTIRRALAREFGKWRR